MTLPTFDSGYGKVRDVIRMVPAGIFDADQSALGGGVMVRTYLNKFSMVSANHGS